MSDFLRYLPLSQHDGSDATVSSDRREQLAVVVESMLELSERSSAFDLDRSLRQTRLSGLWREAGGDGQRLLDLVRDHRRSVRDLASVVTGALSEASRAGEALSLDTTTAGVVALYASGAGAFERRAVISGHTVRATDATWEFGSGPVLEAPATHIAAFLLGVSEDPPRPPES